MKTYENHNRLCGVDTCTLFLKYLYNYLKNKGNFKKK